MMQDKPKLPHVEQRRRRDERTASSRLRFLIRRRLDERQIITPAEVGDALGMLIPEATKLLGRYQWREGDLGQLRAVAARLGLAV